jgi:transcription elongation factor Elf1
VTGECPLCHHPDPVEAVVWKNDARITTLSCCGAKFVWQVSEEAIASIRASIALRREK